MKKTVEPRSTNAAITEAINDNSEITHLRNQVENLKKTVSLQSRDLEHISFLCSTVNFYLDPGRDMLLDGDELKSIIHLIGIIVCESDWHGCE